ncbi:hypothetical protein J7J63_09530 [Candidatus Bipolaricaulota bacterium]|nr:hypothetical protein [Candidatus Bipolaricaulota bacterium]
MACVENIINDKADLKRYINSIKSKDVKKKNKKVDPDQSFNAQGITNPMILAFFTMKHGNQQQLKEQMLEESEEFTTVKDIIQNGKSIIPSFWKKVRGLKHLDSRKMTIFQDLHGKGKNDQIAALEAIQIGIAFHHLVGSVSTEFDLMNKYNISEEEYNQLMPKGEFVPGISGVGTLAAIGKEILATQNIVLKPSRKGSQNYEERQFEVEKVYTDVGAKAVRLLAKNSETKDNFVTIETKDENGGYSPMIINEKFKKSGGNLLSKANLIEGIKIKFNMAKMLNVTDINKVSDADKKLVAKYFRGQTSMAENNLLESKYQTLYTNTRAATYMHRLLIPTNSKGPDTSSNPKQNNADHDVDVSDRVKDVLQKKLEGTMKIPNSLESMFDFIYDEMEKNGKSFEEAARSLGIDDYKEMMGYSDEMDSTAATRASNMGKSLSKTTPLQEFFDNYSQFKNFPIHLQEEIKRNGRGHYMTTYLNPQTDKHFSRFIMQIPDYELPAIENGEMTSTFRHLLAGIQDQAGKDFSVDDILGNTVNPELDGLLSAYEAVDKNNGKQMFIFIGKAFSKFDTKMAGSVWQKHDTLKAIYDVRTMLQNNKDGSDAMFEGTFMPKPDGTASGALIMSMQMAGKNSKDKASLFEALGLSHDVEGNLDDAYDITLNALDQNEIDEKETQSTLTETMNFLVDNKVVKSRRDIAKYASMPVMYSQGEESAIVTVAKDLTEVTYRALESNKMNYELANKMREWIKESNPEYHEEIKNLEKRELVKFLLNNENSKTTYDAVNTYMQKKVTAPLYQVVNNAFVETYLKEHKQITDDIFSKMKALNEKSGDRITIIPPEVIMAATIEHNKDLKEDKNWKFDVTDFIPLGEPELKKLRSERGIPLMKLFGMVNHPEKNATVSRKEYAHNINAHVNLVHSIDFAVLNEAFARTFAEADSDTKNKALADLDMVANGTISVHDAIAAHPTFSEAYTAHYQEATRDINAVFDIHNQMAFELSQMEGYGKMVEAAGGTKIASLVKNAQVANDKKIIVLSKMNFKETNKNGDMMGDKVFGFSEFENQPLQFGKKISTAKNKKKAEKEHKEDQQKAENEEMLTKYVTKKEGAKSHKKVLKIIESGKPYAILDTETTGMDHGGSKELDVNGVVASMPYQVAFRIMNPETGDPETVDIYFHTEKISAGVKAFWKKNDIDMSLNEINDRAAKDGRSNDEKLEYLEKTLKSMPIMAYNSDFDMEVLKHLFKGKEGARKVSRASNDILGAVAHQNFMETGTKRESDSLGSVYKEITTKKPENAHDAAMDVEMTKDVLEVIKPITAKPETTESTSEKSSKQKTENIVADDYTNNDGTKENFEALAGEQIEAGKNEQTREEQKKDVREVRKALRLMKKFSPMVAKFFGDSLEEGRNGSWAVGTKFAYDVESHTITVPNIDTLHKSAGRVAMEHEIAHYQSLGYMSANENDKFVKIITKAVRNIDKYKDILLNLDMDEHAKDRLKYFMETQGNNEARIRSELVAVLGTETGVAREFVRAVKAKNAKDANEATMLVLAVKKVWEMAKKLNFLDTVINPEELIEAINEVMDSGSRFNYSERAAAKAGREKYQRRKMDGRAVDDSYQENIVADPKEKVQERKNLEKALEYGKTSNNDYVTSDPLSNFIAESNSLVADLMYKHFGKNAMSLTEKGAKHVDALLTEKSSIYRDMKKTTLDVWSSDTMEELRAYLVPSSVKQRATLQKIARIFQRANQNHGKITSTEVTKLDLLMDGMSKDEVAKLNDMFGLAPIFGIIKNGGLIYDIADGDKTIDQAIALIEEKVVNDDISISKNFAALYIDGNPIGDYYNIYQEGTTGARVEDVERLTALYALKKIDGSEAMLKELRQNKSDLFDKLVESSLALNVTTLKAYNESGDIKKFRGNMTLEYYEEPFQLVAVSEADIKSGMFQMTDEWKTVIPSDENHGIAVLSRTTGNSQYQEAFGTNIDYGNTDVYMPKGWKPKTKDLKNLIKFGTGKNVTYKVVVPMSKKKEMGLIQNPAQTLLRSYAHIEKIRETQAIRDEIASNSGLRFSIKKDTPTDVAEIERLIDERGKDEPWFIEMEDGMKYSDLSDKIKKRFKTIPTKMSGVKGFGNKLSLVRNDISPWIAGYKRALPFESNPQFRKAFEIVTEAISLMKIHMIIVNPAKVTLDLISTTTLLMSYGVSPITIARGWKKNIGQMSSMSKLKAEQIDLTIRARGGNKVAAYKLKEVEKKLQNHPLMGAMNAGVMQSLTTDIITRDYDTITGLQRSIDKVFNKLTHDNETGDVNNIHKAIMAYAKFGLNVEDLFGWLSKISENTEMLKPVSEELAIMGKRIAKIKNDGDVAKYLSEYFASPSSTLTKMGSVATTYPDAMSRIIYRDHLIAKTGKSEADLTDAEIEDINAKTSDMMPDYAFAPPMVLDATGRFFITPFVSYSARIQRVILNLAERNPLTFFGSLLLAEAFGLDAGDTPYHVVGSNYISKEEFINNVFTDLLDMQTALPTNAFNFDIIA